MGSSCGSRAPPPKKKINVAWGGRGNALPDAITWREQRPDDDTRACEVVPSQDPLPHSW
jgi:hypothetical protein